MAGNYRAEGFELVPTASAPFPSGRRGIWVRASDGQWLYRQPNGSDDIVGTSSTSAESIHAVPIDAPTNPNTSPVYNGTLIEWRPALLADEDPIIQATGLGGGLRTISVGQSPVGGGDDLEVTAGRGASGDLITAGSSGGATIISGAPGGEGSAAQISGNGGGVIIAGGDPGQDLGGGEGDAGSVDIIGGTIITTGLPGHVRLGSSDTRSVIVGNDLNQCDFIVKPSGFAAATFEGSVEIQGASVLLQGATVSGSVDAGYLSSNQTGVSPAFPGSLGLIFRESVPLGWATVTAAGSFTKAVSPVSMVAKTATGTYQFTLLSGAAINQHLTGRIQLNGARGFADVPVVAGPATVITVTTRNTSDVLTDIGFTVWFYVA